MNGRLYFNKKEWFFETSLPGRRRWKKDGFHIEKEIFKGKSKFQDIYIFESLGFGKILVLDGIVQFSESDEFIYHEMISHLSLVSHRNPRRLLIIGGGDGGALREATKHPLKEIYLVDIDKKIVEVSKKYLAFVSKGSFRDKRLRLLFEDGKNFIRSHRNLFDIIIVDSTDPVGPAKTLFQLDFYKDVFTALKKDGMAIFQLSPFLDFELVIKNTARRLKKLFTFVNPLRLSMPSYSCGCEYCFILASKEIDPAKISLFIIKKRLGERLKEKAKMLKYYTPEAHLASMVLPKMWQLKNGKKI